MADDDKSERMRDQNIDWEDVAESDLVTRRGNFRVVAFRDKLGGHEHIALVMGEARLCEDVLVRVHSECVTGDIFGAMRCECGEQLNSALDAIVREGCGVLVYRPGARRARDRPGREGAHPCPAG
jgi:GTP cyclohydrolase II